MVSEITNILFAGIISGWLVAVTQPIYDFIIKLCDKKDISKLLSRSLFPIFWLLAMMVFVLKIYG